MEHIGIADFKIEELQPIEDHPRGWTEVDDAFVEEIKATGNRPYVYPIVRAENGHDLIKDVETEIKVIDGLRRIQALKKLNKRTVKCLVVQCSEREALRASISLNDRYQPLSKSQKETSMKKLMEMEGGAGADVETETEQDVTKAPELGEILENIPGVGESTKIRVVNEFGNTENLRKKTVDDLSSISGVGEKKAKTIKRRIE